jgi:signal transduction histidine kinase
VQETIDHASRTRTDFDFEHRLLMPDGTVKHLHVMAHAMQNSPGNLEFVGALMDDTEQKWAQAERARLDQRLRQAEKMEAVGRLAGAIAHDFNNVLAGVIAYGEMILDEAPSGSPVKRYAQNCSPPRPAAADWSRRSSLTAEASTASACSSTSLMS